MLRNILEVRDRRRRFVVVEARRRAQEDYPSEIKMQKKKNEREIDLNPTSSSKKE